MKTIPSTTEYAVLGLLAFGERSGYDLHKLAGRSVGFLWAPAKSQIYAVLHRLVERGLARRRDVEQSRRPDKQLYRATPAGRRALEAWLERVEGTAEPGSNELLLKVFFGGLARPGTALEQVRAYRAAVAARLAGYEETERLIVAGADPEDFFPHLTLQHGMAGARAILRWADGTIAALERRAAA